MKLLTKEVVRKLPSIYKGDGKSYVKFFTPDAQWTWYVQEANGVLESGDEVPLTVENMDQVKDVVFFGLVSGLERELGYFTLNELKKVRGKLGLPIERDMYFTPTVVE